MFKIAQLGAGRMGGIHARSAAGDPRLDLAYIVDTRSDAAGALASEVGAELSTFDAVLADEEIKGVIVASSTDTHLDFTLACLEAGKAVFCEKPLDLDAGRLRAHEAAFRAAKAPLFVAFNRRHDPHFQALRAKVSSGAIGELETLHLINHDPASPPPHFIPTSGGLFKDFTVHDFDTARWIVGEKPVEVFAWASCLVDPMIAEMGDVDTARLILRTASGRLCVISNTRRSGYGYDQRIEAYGSKGMALAANLPVSTISAWTEGGATGDPIHFGFLTRYAEAYRNEMSHFAAVIAGECEPLTGYDASIDSLALAEAAALSVQTGAPVRL